MEVENIIHNGFIKAYYIWKKQVENDNERNPLIYDVEKVNGEFIIHTNIEEKKQKIK